MEFELDAKFELDGNTIEFRTSGSGSIDPWYHDYAKQIGLGIWGTSDMAEFMLVNDRIYKFERFDDAYNLYYSIKFNETTTWSEVQDSISDLNSRNRIEDWGTLEEMKVAADKQKQQNNVWTSIPENKRREVHEWFKTLSNEDKSKWYDEQIKRLENGLRAEIPTDSR